MGPILKRLRESLSKTRQNFLTKIENLLKGKTALNEAILEELEGILLQADLGVKTTSRVLRRIREEGLTEVDKVKARLRRELNALLLKVPRHLRVSNSQPTVILVVGVNGVGKTTSIAKLAYRFKEEGRKVLLAASDTFRAAAIPQLEVWGERVGVETIKHHRGADPAAVAYDALSAAQSRGMDILIVDTAGRLHTRRNLMEELKKMKRVLEKRKKGAPEEILLVLDATIGQNSISQARLFKEALEVTGIFLAKLDGTAKGGVIVAIEDELNLPVKLVGTGEKLDDLAEFNPDQFLQALFE